MAEEAQYTSKRKYDYSAAPSAPRGTGFSHSVPSYNSVPPPVDEIQLAKQRAQEIAARLFNNAEAKRPKVENGGGLDSNAGQGFISGATDFGHKPMLNTTPLTPSYGYGNPSKKIEIPNGRVGVIIGKGGETIKHLQLQSGAKIQVTRDMDADPHSLTREVELIGPAESIAKAEQLIKDVLAEAESGGSGLVSQRLIGQPGGAERFVMKVPNNKVGFIIGKGGDTIKNMQASTGARIQVIPLHLPPGDTSTERNLHIDGTSEQIESAKQLVNEVIGENRVRNSMAGGYSQQGYQAQPPTSWEPPSPQVEQQGCGYMKPGAYPGQPTQYTQQPYAGYRSQPTSGGYATGWDPSAAAAPVQTSQAGGAYDYYNQQAPQTQAPSGYNQQSRAYGGYGGYASAPQSGYVQPQPGYDQQGFSNPTSGYNVANQTSDGQPASYGAHADNASEAPPPPPPLAPQSGYGQQSSPNPSYPQGSTQPGYAIPPTSQPGYGAQPSSGYGSQPGYGQLAQKSPSAAPPQGGYAQHPPSTYGIPGYSQGRYGANPATQLSYAEQQPPAYGGSYGSGYPQQPVYAADAAPQVGQPTGGVVPKASPQQG